VNIRPKARLKFENRFFSTDFLESYWIIHAVTGYDQSSWQAIYNVKQPFVRNASARLALNAITTGITHAMHERLLSEAQNSRRHVHPEKPYASKGKIAVAFPYSLRRGSKICSLKYKCQF
jgi:hypothetical protein